MARRTQARGQEDIKRSFRGKEGQEEDAMNELKETITTRYIGLNVVFFND